MHVSLREALNGCCLGERWHVLVLVPYLLSLAAAVDFMIEPMAWQGNSPIELVAL